MIKILDRVKPLVLKNDKLPAEKEVSLGRSL